MGNRRKKQRHGQSALVVVPKSAEEQRLAIFTQISSLLRLQQRVPEHLASLEVPATPELVEALSIACVFAVLKIGYGRTAASLIKRPASASLTREIWPSHKTHASGLEIVQYFGMERLLQP